MTDRINHEHLGAVFNSIQEALVEIDSDNRIVRMNRSCEQLFETDLASMSGLPIFNLTDNLLSDGDVEHLPVSIAIKNSRAQVSGTCIYLRRGELTHLAWVLSPLASHDVSLGKLLALIDYTDKEKLSSALVQQREDFLAVLNHRLQTPLLAAHRIIQLILDGQFGNLSLDQAEVISALGENMDEINRLMNMIMDIYRYRTSSKELRKSEANIKDLLSKLQLPKSERLALEINCCSALVQCDPREVLRMVQHLIDNAVKYAKSKVSINVSVVENSQLAICVEDDGKGIAKEDIKGLFEKFYLVSASGKYAPVTGAGLCLCSEIAKAHQGKISCSSEEGRGTKFEVRLPLSSNK